MKITMAPSKNVQVSERQKEILLEYMVAHPSFSYGRLIGPLAKQKSNSMYEELTSLLNAEGCGASKTSAQWKVCWAGWRTKTKNKLTSIINYTKGTGSGPPPPSKMTPLELQLIDFLGKVVATGDEESADCTFEISAENDINMQPCEQSSPPPSELEPCVEIVETQLATTSSVFNEMVPGAVLISIDKLLSKEAGLPETPDPKIKKRKNADFGKYKFAKKTKSQKNNTAYKRARRSMEDERMTVFEEMRSSLKIIADATVRMADALGKIAEAKEAKYLRQQ